MKKTLLFFVAFAGILFNSCTDKPQPSPQGDEYSLGYTIEVAGRQGVASDGKYLYVSSSTALYKYTRYGILEASNENPFTSLELEANHFGDIDVYDGNIYTGIETFIDGVGKNIQVAVYDAETLEYKYSIPWNAESGQVEVCGLAVDRDNNRVWMADWVQGHELYCYDLETGEYVGKTTLDPAPRLQQGIFCKDGQILISSDDGDADNDEPDHIYCCTPVIGDTVKVEMWREMGDFERAGEIEGITMDPTNDDFIVLSNRGSRIVLGMVKGFYEGYESEIHELYVYQNNQPKFVKQMFPISTKQGSFLYEDEWLVTLSNDGHAIVYSLPDGRDTAVFDLASVFLKPHCNVAKSVKIKKQTYAYITEWNGEHRCFVEKINHEKGSEEWRCELVQTISCNIPGEISGFGNNDWIEDFENGKMYLFTYSDGTPKNDIFGNSVTLLEFPLKPISDGDIVYTEADILRRSVIPYVSATQDKEIWGGKLYVAAGLKTKKPTQVDRAGKRGIAVIDLATLTLEKFLPLGFYNEEPEGLDLWKGKILMTFNHDYCYEMQF